MKYSHDRSVLREQRRREKEDFAVLFENYDIAKYCDICKSVKLLFDPDDFTKAACPNCGVSVDLTKLLSEVKERLEDEGEGHPILESAHDTMPDNIEERERQEIEKKGGRVTSIRTIKPS
jgi:hypothetical protein